MPDYSRMADAWESLTVFREVMEGAIGDAAFSLISTLAAGHGDGTAAGRLYRELAVLLVEWAETAPAPVSDAWQSYLVERILEGECAFGRRAAAVPLEQIRPSLRAMARADLAHLRCLYDLTGDNVSASLGKLQPGREHLSWSDGAGLSGVKDAGDLRGRFFASSDWGLLLEPLAASYLTGGIGSLQRCYAFRWSPIDGLVGVTRPDPIQLEDLVGYDFQKSLLIRNTEQFLAGYPCNNILLYGARGTGKSSLVKALLNAYAPHGLRLVEVARDDMGDFPRIVRHLRERPQRFLLFADDLSYDDAELNYRELKAALEGSIEGRPDNVLLCATSNRRHLIKERFRDRESADDEIHTHDTSQEKLSLADRFGLTLSFASPTQPEYLRMVDTIAARRGLKVDSQELHAAALRWAALHNTPSGRTARQFVDDLEGAMLAATVTP